MMMMMMMRGSTQLAAGFGRMSKGFMSVGPSAHKRAQLSLPSAWGATLSANGMFSVSALPWPFSSRPRDFSLPNSSWGSEMMRLYDHYNNQCEVTTESGKKTKGPWKRLPSYNRSLKYATGGIHLSKIIQSEARLFTRNSGVQGAAFEYVMFHSEEEQKCVCVFQAGHLLEGPPGYVHGGAIATMIDSVTGTHATFISGPVMTANLNINYRSPITLGGTVLLESSLDKREGRKTFVSCKVTSTDGAKLHTEATALFLSISVGHLLRG
ncbi:acyl-coenzyme A thioesterase THEM4 isoform X2 [Lampris incognitus]|uniref:acyl-coenzyme A thioesterase THEM4 isoform X2 n=1 Tax=Lampris incognitus TaxID=2546036 RepID=UPI0024B56D56|nr:acyl-coenzyme A thioesterase THEM4 isoform X2 [Lampris incognitus]